LSDEAVACQALVVMMMLMEVMKLMREELRKSVHTIFGGVWLILSDRGVRTGTESLVVESD
jgi:hypothetical protein